MMKSRRKKVVTLKKETHLDRIGRILKLISMTIFSMNLCTSIFELQSIGTQGTLSELIMYPSYHYF